jgi:hypothetical protein
MLELKPISKDAMEAALDRVERYRLLNEPMEAESICLDVLAAEPDHPRALVLLLLSLTDQFPERLGTALPEAEALLEKLHDEYSRAYYHGVICERKAKTHLSRGGPGDGEAAWEWFHKAMQHSEHAEALRPAKNDEAILRWNTCARTLNRNPELEPSRERVAEHMLE